MAGETQIVVTATGHIRVGDHDEDLAVSQARDERARCDALDKALVAAEKLQLRCRYLTVVVLALGTLALGELLWVAVIH